MTFTIRFRGVDSAPDGDGYCPVFDVFHDRQRVLRFSLGLTFEKSVQLQHDPRVDQKLLGARGNDAVLRMGLRRLEAEIAAGLVDVSPSNAMRILYLSGDDLDELDFVMRAKTCLYQERVDTRDLWCLAAAAFDPTMVTQIGKRHIAPTTSSLCLACTLPDTDSTCSHLSHPQVIGIESDQVAVIARQVSGALCDLGRDEIGNPALCRPGGNACWERLAEQQSPTVLMHTGERAIHYALDHLDVAWRAAFSTKTRLFQPKSAETLGSLVQSCTSRAELGQRLNELDTVLHWLQVPDDAQVIQDPSARSLGRLRAFLHMKLAERGAAAEDLKLMETAIADLRRVNDVRVALEHPGDARATAAEAFQVIGLAYPPVDWASAWERVQAVTVTALYSIAGMLANLS
jgi:hypothetical protein